MTALGNISSSDDLHVANHIHPTGVIIPFAVEIAADANGQPFPGWIYCRGQIIDSSAFVALDALIGAAAPAGATHACNGGVSPASGKFRVPNLQRALPIHKTPSGTASVLGGKSGGLPYGDGWAHAHGVGSLYLPGHTHYSLGSYGIPSHSHSHNLYENDHTHSVDGASHQLWGTSGPTTYLYIDQTTSGASWSYGSAGFSQNFPTDGGGNVDNYRLGSTGNQALNGSATGSSTGPAGPYLMMNWLIKV